MSAREPSPPSVIERNAVNIQRAVVAVCVLLVLGDVAFAFLGHRHTHFGFEGYIGVYGAIGFVSYVGLVLSAKVLRMLVMRPEDFYERPVVAALGSAVPVPAPSVPGAEPALPDPEPPEPVADSEEDPS
ncbi:MAG: hypothetical protein R3B40_25130 [Polyangiales bacterium]|nr:hypothetical protein [Myxococcales bacterium]MCB9661940.1 hypothetical protein [Sandaracinaceae bacterium]